MAAFLRVIAALPLIFFHAAGILLGWTVWLVSPRFRRITRHNLQTAGYKDARIFRQSVAAAGQGVLELIPVWFRPQQSAAALMRDEPSRQLIEQAHREGKGIIFVTPHLGCFEVTAQWYTQNYGAMTALFSPPKRPFVQRLISGGREKPHLKLAPPDLSGIRAMLRALKAGEAVGILPDQVPGRGEGEWAPFFGQPAYTMTLVQRLAEATGAVIVMAYAERLPWGRGFRGVVERMAEREPGETASRHLNRALEDLIRRCPGQYLWSYNRYKVPAGVEPPAS
jgi:KDO2-lipid IV(A) lauroyltransferase